MTRNRVLLLFAVALVVAVGIVLLWPAAPPTAVSPPAAVDAGPPPGPDAGPVAAAPAEVTLRDARGRVEVQRGGAGAWVAVTTGDALAPKDIIRTAPDARVELVAGEHVVELLGGTDVEVGALTADLTSYLIGRGLIGANAAMLPGQPARALEVRARDTDTIARAESGRFRMSSNGQGTVAVGVQDGEVRVSGNGGAVVLRGGQRTLVRPGAPPTAPQPLSPSLLLKVAWPSEKASKKRVITLKGRTEAGALVFAMGRPVDVDADGNFRTRLTLKEGANRIQVEAHDVSGNDADAADQVLVNSVGADSRFDTEKLWER